MTRKVTNTNPQPQETKHNNIVDTQFLLFPNTHIRASFTAMSEEDHCPIPASWQEAG
jgi:hypothetical protein